jgi:hypothetical protein
MRISNNTSRGLACALVAALSLGCGAGKGSIEGKVTYRGKPLPVGTVSVFADGNQVLSGKVESDGSYRVLGVPAGPATLTVATPPPPPPAFVPAVKPPPIQDPNFPREMLPNPPVKTVPIPKRYADPKESSLGVTVERDKVTSFDIDLKD